MSTLVENVAKVTAAHAALKTAIAAKGVAVPDGTKLTGMPALVGQIQTGGATEPTNSRACFAGDSPDVSIVVPNVMVVDMLNTDNLYYFFYYCGASSITLPAGFGKSATTLHGCFNGCTRLASLTIHDGFGQNAIDVTDCFRECRVLQHLTLPAGFGQVATNVGACFLDCISLTTLTLPAGFGQAATSIDHCFRFCRSLTTLTLPAGFGQAATSTVYCFQNCPALTTITGNPNFKVSVDFSSCTKLTHDSLMVVISGLQTVTETQTLTLGSTNLSKLTDAEKQIATDKGWTLA